MTAMTDNNPTGSAPPEKENEKEPDASPAAEDPGYLTQTGEAAAADGSVAPIIGGLPAVEGSAWDIGAATDDRGAGIADEEDQADDEDSSSG
jgi:hypothetical protein